MVCYTNADRDEPAVSPTHRPALLADVARLAGVSSMTVSRVLNHGDRVSETTRARVLQAIDELGYRSNRAARTLAGGKSRVIGVISIETELFGPTHTLFSIEEAARLAGHTISFATVSDPTVAALRSALDHLSEAHVDGVIVIAPLTLSLDSLTEMRSQVPMVVTSAASRATTSAAASTVGIDQTLGGRLATAHLLDLGHRTVHHVGGPDGWIDANARSDGWRFELRAREVPVPQVVAGDWSPKSGYDAGVALAADPDVTAIFVGNDQMALGVILALEHAGRSVPGDVSVVGFDDIAESEFFRPPLTTVRQDLREVGRQSVDLLLATIAGDEPTQVRIEPTLVVRASTTVRANSN